MGKLSKSLSWDLSIWNDIEEYSKENEKGINESAEELMKEGINSWKNKKEKVKK